MILRYTSFNKYNVATAGAQNIVLRTSGGNVLRECDLGHLALPTKYDKSYSFLAISDSHVIGTSGTDGMVDLARALTYAEESDALFTAHCGDVTDGGTEWQFTQLKALLDGYTKPKYAIGGNHDCYSLGTATFDSYTPYFGNPLYYTFTQGDDVFIMIGEASWTESAPFIDGELQFLYETLEANRNKRCFVFQHILSLDEGDSGNPDMFYVDNDIFALTETNLKQKECFINLMKHYKNAIWFHGHSHSLFESQEFESYANYTDAMGYKSVHIPSITKPKQITDGIATTIEAGSQGYVVDVYPDGLHLRGRDFVGEKFMPIATYWIDTKIRPMQGGTFTDTTGILSI